MKHFKLAKLLATLLGLALMAAPIMAFSGCDLSSLNSETDQTSSKNDAASQLFDVYLFDIQKSGNFYSYTGLKNIISAKSSENQSNVKSLEINTLNSLMELCENVGDQYAQNALIFDKHDSNGEKINSYNKSFSLISTCINSVNEERILITSDDPVLRFGELLEKYAKDEITEILQDSDNISDLDILNCYEAFFNGYLKNAKEYILSNYTRYEDLTDEQINQILNIFKENMSTTAEIVLKNYKKRFKKYMTPVSFNEANITPVPEILFVSNDDGYSISTIVNKLVDSFYPADIMYFEQPFIDYYQACIDPLFQEAFGYTWTDCVKLTEDPDLHPINWGNYKSYLALLGMTADDVPMPTIS